MPIVCVLHVLYYPVLFRISNSDDFKLHYLENLAEHRGVEKLYDDYLQSFFSSKKSKSSHSASRKLASSSKHSAASVKLSETLPGKSNSVHRHDKVSIGAGVSAKISPNDFGDAKLAQTDCAKPSSSSSLLRIMVPNSSGEYEDSTTPSALRKSQAGVKMQHSRHGETSSSHISRRRKCFDTVCVLLRIDELIKSEDLYRPVKFLFSYKPFRQCNLLKCI